jgi:hypothetical protein
MMGHWLLCSGPRTTLPVPSFSNEPWEPALLVSAISLSLSLKQGGASHSWEIQECGWSGAPLFFFPFIKKGEERRERERERERENTW